jgi:murein DD-endopeptidase MepM/ murein hydrolase activator NlpD
LPTWIGLGEQFITRLTTAGSILSNYGDELVKVMTDTGDVFMAAMQNISRFDFSDSSFLVRSSLNELKLSIDSLGDGINSAFQVLIQPFKALEKVPDAYGKLPSILPGFEPPEPSPGGGGGAGAGRWKPLLDIIASGEGGYTSIAPGDQNPNLTKMTIAEANRAVGLKGGRGAIGRYQFTSPISQAKSAGLNPDKDLFNPDNQDKMAVAIIEKKRGGKDWLSGKITDEQFGYQLAREFAGLKQPNGVGFYDGDGRNKATVNWSSTKISLKKVKSASATAKITPSPSNSLLNLGSPAAAITSLFTGQKPAAIPAGQRALAKGDIFTKSLGKGVEYVQIGDLYGSRGGKHGGIDILAPNGTYIALRADCEVVGQGIYGSYGLVMDVWVPAYGVQLRMAHLSTVLIKSGKIPAGTSFARVGVTGNATGPHIHFEYDTKKGRMVGGGAGNPEAYVRLLYLTSKPIGRAFSGTTPLVPGAPSIQSQQAAEVGMESTSLLEMLLGGLSQEREGRKVVVVDDRQPNNMAMIPTSGGDMIGDISIDESSLLNTFIKNKFLLDLTYV